jgi:hypothetical protein
LRADVGNKVAAFGGFQRGGFDFVAVFVRQGAETAQDSSSVMRLLQPVALTGNGLSGSAKYPGRFVLLRTLAAPIIMC